MNNSLTEVEVPLLDINKVITEHCNHFYNYITLIQAGGGAACVGHQRRDHHCLHVPAVGLQPLPHLQGLVQNTLL